MLRSKRQATMAFKDIGRKQMPKAVAIVISVLCEFARLAVDRQKSNGAWSIATLNAIVSQ